VTVGGVPLVELPLRELRGHVALLTQEHHVFMGTLRDNVVLADPSATDARVREALEAVGAWSWVERLPAGVDTPVGSGQHMITAAQAQQVALARLLVADPHTLILDEATSMLDPSSVRSLERSLRALLDERPVVSIAHRLETGRDADRIAVVRDGVIAELGSHVELLARGGGYAELWRSWQGSDT
jgi:ABC-type multidrug transport system fused ATPase/permease subunit